MSNTKALRKALKTMTDTDIVVLRDKLQAELSAERNMMIRSSLQQRIRMCTAEIEHGNRPTK